MSNVKTAVSLERSLFEQAEALADEMNVSRSRLFALALQDFIRRYENKRLLDNLNAVYEDDLDAEEQATLRAMLHLHREIVEDEW